MGRRKEKNSSTSNNAGGSSPEITVVDGKVVVYDAPRGETANSDNAVDEAAILAELAGETETPAAAAEDVEIVAQDMVEEPDVELEPADEEAILAEVEAEEKENAPAAATKPSRKRSTGGTKPATTPTVQRQFFDVAQIDEAAFTAALNANSAKKVGEKAMNLKLAIETGKKLSGYTAIAVKQLVADGKITGPDLVKAYLNAGLKEGTARAQAQQMTALFKIVGLASPSNDNPRELVLADEGLAKELASIAA